MNSCLLEYATVFSIKNNFQPIIYTFCGSTILLSKMKLLFLNLYTSPLWTRHYFNHLLPQEVCTNLQIKRFSLMKFWYKILMYGGTDFQSNNIENHLSHK